MTKLFENIIGPLSENTIRKHLQVPNLWELFHKYQSLQLLYFLSEKCITA